MITITIEGQPEPWKAPKRNGNHYFSPNYEIKEDAKWQVHSQYFGEIITTAIKVNAFFFFSPPSYIIKKNKKKLNQMLAGEIYHVKKPDVDNLSKFAIDSLKGLVIKDDNQVVSLKADKFYHLHPHTILEIYPL